MKRWLRISLAGVGAATFAVVGTCIAILHSVPEVSDLCQNTVLNEYPAPDQRAKVVVFERDCGATTPFSTQVSLVARDAELPNEGGNVFIADTDHGRAPSGAGGGPEVRVRWESPNRLLLEYSAAARTFKIEHEWNGVVVRYAQLP